MRLGDRRLRPWVLITAGSAPAVALHSLDGPALRFFLALVGLPRLLGLRARQRIWRAGPSTRPPPGAPCAHPGGLRLEALRTGGAPTRLGGDRHRPAAFGSLRVHPRPAARPPSAGCGRVASLGLAEGGHPRSARDMEATDGGRVVCGSHAVRPAAAGRRLASGRAGSLPWRLPKAAGRCLSLSKSWVNQSFGEPPAAVRQGAQLPAHPFSQAVMLTSSAMTCGRSRSQTGRRPSGKSPFGGCRRRPVGA